MEKFNVSTFAECIKRLSNLYLKTKQGETLTDLERVEYSNLIESLGRYLPVSAWK